MKLLILGGTRFLGRHLAEQALARGDDVTLLHRGQSGPALFPQARHLIADRNHDLSALGSASWDAVIDTSAYVPRHVKSVAAALGTRAGHYTLVSTISVYRDFASPGIAEDAPLQTLADPTVETVTGETYGGLKALCEAEAEAAFGPRCAIVRPGLIVGPHDPTGRFTWWATRMQRGGTVIAPGSPTDAVQFIDARDLAAWMLRIAGRASGTFNATGPDRPIPMGDFLETARSTLNPAARLEWVPEPWLLAQGVVPWSELPVWVPRESAGLHHVDIGRALAAGLGGRPLAQTLADTAAWASAVAAPAPQALDRPAAGMAPEREAELLARWAAETRA